MKEDSFNDDRIISVEVDSDVIAKVRTGEITHFAFNINDDNYTLVLEHVDGHLILMVDEMPDTYYGCNFYNNGQFPYVINESLDFLMLYNDHEECLTKIIGVSTEPGKRFRFEVDGKPSVEDPEGECCVWKAAFEIVPLPAENRAYLMRWNPSISSFTEADFKECLARAERGTFRINWSIYDWQEARRGDFFYMMRVGDEKAGIVFTGQFLSDPYPDDDWAGSSKRRMYVDMVCYVASAESPLIPVKTLDEAIPDIKWWKGHSGVLLPADIVNQISELFGEE